jgi:hypothetical protein
MGGLFLVVLIIVSVSFIVAFRNDYKNQGVSGKDGCLLIIAILMVTLFFTFCLIGQSADYE